MTRHPYHRLTSPRRVGAIRRLQELVERISDDTTYNVAESSVLSWLSTATGYTLTAVADIATYMKPSEARVQYAALITAAMVGAISPLGNYAANDVVPATVLDFENDVYAGTVSAFSDLSFAATSNATVIDSDGVLKWRAHCLNTYSSDMTHADWTGTSGATKAASSETSPYSGATPAQFISSGVAGSGVRNTYSALPAGVSVAGTIAFKIGTAGFGYVQINGTTGGTTTASAVHVNLSTGAVGSVIALANGGLSNAEASVVDAGDGWYELKLSGGIGTGNTKAEIYGGPSDDATSRQTTSGKYVNVSGGRITRSGLGGMQNNPLTGDSYVPTTSAAVYKERFDYATGSRRLLIEPTATTNLMTYSSDFSNWIEAGAGTLTAGGGNVLGIDCYSATASSVGYYVRSSTTLAASTTHTFWSIVKGTSARFQLRVYDNNAASFTVTENFDLSGTPASGTGRHVYQLGTNTWLVGYTFTTAATVTAHTVYLYPDAVNGTATVEILHAQVEAASVPHSAIPTAGATATRAAETLALPAAKIADYQTPTYIGDELVTNGTFDTDLTAWTATGGDGTAAWDAGTMRLTNGSSSGYMTQGSAFTTESGKVYEVTFDVDLVNNIKVFISNASNGTAAFADSGIKSASGTYSFVFVATAATTYVYAQMATSLAGATAAFDNVSVREINPLAVSFAMSGEMTYADNDSTLTATMLSWQGPVGNSIIWYLTTSGSYTGALRASHAANSVWEADQSPNPGYTPGVNVPVSFAYRATSTTAQAAAAGAAGAVNNTLLGLFDGSIRNISLAYSGGPMRIAKFIMWNEDIGQTGIEEATA